MGIKMLKRENLSDKLADIYGKKIIHNELKSGDIIMETQVSKEWGVSRSPVRDALHMLEKQKLVEKDKRGSYKVLELTADYIGSLFDALDMIYQYSFSKAAERMTKDNYSYLLSLTDKIEKSVESRDYDAYIEGIATFGLTILNAANNPIVEQIAIALMPTAKRIQFAAIEVSSSHLKESCIHIRKSLDYLQTKDFQKFAAAFRDFSNVSRNVLINYIEADGKTV